MRKSELETNSKLHYSQQMSWFWIKVHMYVLYFNCLPLHVCLNQQKTTSDFYIAFKFFTTYKLWEFIYVIKIVHCSFMPNFKMFKAGLQMRSTTFKAQILSRWRSILKIKLVQYLIRDRYKISISEQLLCFEWKLDNECGND